MTSTIDKAVLPSANRILLASMLAVVVACAGQRQNSAEQVPREINAEEKLNSTEKINGEQENPKCISDEQLSGLLEGFRSKSNQERSERPRSGSRVRQGIRAAKRRPLAHATPKSKNSDKICYLKKHPT